MFELIPSKTLREYYKQMGFSFSDFEKATLIWHSLDKTRQEILDALSELADETDDKYTKAQISERLNYEKKAYDIFLDNSSEKYVYVVSEQENDVSIGFFSNYDTAYLYASKYINKNKIGCNINKQKIVDTPDEATIYMPLIDNTGGAQKYFKYHGMPESSVGLNLSCEVNYFYSREFPEEGSIVDPFKKDRFENHFVNIRCNIPKITYVHNMMNNTYGILIETDEEWHEYLKQNNVYMDFNEIGLSVIDLTEFGFWHSDQVNPLYLEIANIPLNPTDKKSVALHKAMEAMSNYLIGNQSESLKKDLLKYSKKYSQTCFEIKWKKECGIVSEASNLETIFY